MKHTLKYWYRIADWIIYPLMYHVAGYRKKVVRKNLRNSFPEKSAKELKEIEKKFYHHFADIVAEVLFSYRATDDEMAERIDCCNLPEVERLAKEHGAIIYMLGHFGNWEYTADVQNRYANPEMRHYNVYRRLKNKKIDQKMLHIREHLSGEGSCIEKTSLLRKMIQLRKDGIPHSIGLISDQKPRPEVTRFWGTFLNQETGFLDGGEVLAKKFGYPVFFVHFDEPERGHYVALPQLITDDPQNTEPNYITSEFARRLEANIREYPHLWLWTHNRWKWKKPEGV